MLRRALIAAAPLALAAASAFAAEGKKDEKVEAGQYVDVAPVALPIVVGGRLVNYVFAYVRINLMPGVDSVKMREKEPFFRDAIVRPAHRTPFTLATDYTVIDEAKLRATVTREAVLIGGKAVKSVVVTSQQPKRRQGLPTPSSGT